MPFLQLQQHSEAVIIFVLTLHVAQAQQCLVSPYYDMLKFKLYRFFAHGYRRLVKRSGGKKITGCLIIVKYIDT